MSVAKKRGRKDIAKAGRRVMVRKQAASLSSVKQSMRDIERDMESFARSL